MAIKKEENMTKTLTELFNDVESDKGTLDTTKASWYNKDSSSSFYSQPSVNYTATYEKLFDGIRHSVENFVEIGVCDPRCPGGSLKAWYNYFVNSRIYGLDNFWDNDDLQRKYLKAFNNDRTHVYYCDQNKKSDMNDVFSHIESPDIVIDDGSHWPSSIMVTWATVFPYLMSGGYFIIEDLQIEEVIKYKSHLYAYDNLQITNIISSYIKTGYMPRLYISKEEYAYILDNIANIQMFSHHGYMLACIQKK